MSKFIVIIIFVTSLYAREGLTYPSLNTVMVATVSTTIGLFNNTKPELPDESQQNREDKVNYVPYIVIACSAALAAAALAVPVVKGIISYCRPNQEGDATELEAVISPAL